MAPPGTIKHLLFEAELVGPKPTRRVRLVLDDMEPEEVCEALGHELSALFCDFDVVITPIPHTPADPV